VVYSGYNFPNQLRDSALIFKNLRQFGIVGVCHPKSVYLKIFGAVQNYEKLVDPTVVANELRKQWSGNELIIDWKFEGP
jgi:hypothetical protein